MFRYYFVRKKWLILHDDDSAWMCIRVSIESRPFNIQEGVFKAVYKIQFHACRHLESYSAYNI